MYKVKIQERKILYVRSGILWSFDKLSVLSLKKSTSTFLKSLGLAFFAFIKPANSIESYEKSWTAAIINGSLSKNSSFKYYLESQLRLINDDYVFNQLLFLGGLGYHINNTNMTVYLGASWILEKAQRGNEKHEERLWEQINWIVLNTPNLNINSRTRLEERKDNLASQIAFRLRERIWLKVPFKSSDKYSFSIFNEFFLNLNHPQWVSPYFFEQNRAFIGISAQTTKSMVIDVGYLNQYIHAVKNRLNNVIFLSFTVNW